MNAESSLTGTQDADDGATGGNDAERSSIENDSGNSSTVTPAGTTSPTNGDGSGDRKMREPLITRTDQIFVAVTAMILIACMALHWARISGWGSQPVEIDRMPALQHEFSVEVNSGTWVEFMQLEGIGEILARRIVEDRETNGPFESIDEITRVKGIGAKTLAKMKPFLRFAPPEE